MMRTSIDIVCSNTWDQTKGETRGRWREVSVSDKYGTRDWCLTHKNSPQPVKPSITVQTTTTACAGINTQRRLVDQCHVNSCMLSLVYITHQFMYYFHLKKTKPTSSNQGENDGFIQSKSMWKLVGDLQSTQSLHITCNKYILWGRFAWCERRHSKCKDYLYCQ